MPKVLILDFDGVIIESVGIKTRAFRQLFSMYPEYIDKIIDFHLMNDGLSRYKKFEHIYANILKKPLSEDLSRQLGIQFSMLALDEVKKCPFVPGAVELLKSCKIPTYIASGTPELELRQIVAARGLSGYFSGVFGTPAAKSEITEAILKREGFEAQDCLFVGDTLTDYTEAVKVGVGFIGRWDGKLPKKNPFLGLGVPIVTDLLELACLIESDLKVKS